MKRRCYWLQIAPKRSPSSAEILRLCSKVQTDKNMSSGMTMFIAFSKGTYPSMEVIAYPQVRLDSFLSKPSFRQRRLSSYAPTHESKCEALRIHPPDARARKSARLADSLLVLPKDQRLSAWKTRASEKLVNFPNRRRSIKT